MKYHDNIAHILIVLSLPASLDIQDFWLLDCNASSEKSLPVC